MPLERQYFKIIPSIYKRQTLDVYMFAYVQGQLDTLSSITIKQAILLFLDRYDISEDDFNFETAQQVFYKLRDEVNEL